MTIIFLNKKRKISVPILGKVNENFCRDGNEIDRKDEHLWTSCMCVIHNSEKRHILVSFSMTFTGPYRHLAFSIRLMSMKVIQLTKMVYTKKAWRL